MKERVFTLAKYYLFWVVFFALQKPVFLLWQHRLMGDISFTDCCRVIVHGLPLDCSIAAYISMVMGLILCIGVWLRPRFTRIATDILTGVCLFVGIWTLLGDNGCFPAWGYHLDKSVFVYLASPREALACAEWWVWVLGLVGFVVLFFLFWRLYRFVIPFSASSLSPGAESRSPVASSLLLLLLTAVLFLPARGSVTVSTMNTGRVYFSDNPMLNQAAINPLFHIVESLSEQTFDTRKYTYMSSEEAAAAVRSLYPADPMPSRMQIPDADHIILVILESFSLNAWSCMPHMRQLADEGICFSNAYASSYRTDRGVVAVLSGFPGQPTSSLMTAPAKSARLPNLGLTLGAEGYETQFFYGGDEDFTNMRSYLMAGGFHRRVCDKDFPLSDRLSKWGVPDHILFPFAARQLEQNSLVPGRKTLDVILSLSSHEPFDVSYHHFEHPYLNAVAYTDSCLGSLTERLRQLPEWDKTLLVLVPDHGYPYPDGLPNFRPERYRIPMIIAGGAVREPLQVPQLCSQIDLVPTLLALMGVDYSAYRYGKNVLAADCPEFAFFSFNDGFGLILSASSLSPVSGSLSSDEAVNDVFRPYIPADTVVIDATTNQPLIPSANSLSPVPGSQSPVASMDTLSRALMQSVMEYIETL